MQPAVITSDLSSSLCSIKSCPRKVHQHSNCSLRVCVAACAPGFQQWSQFLIGDTNSGGSKRHSACPPGDLGQNISRTKVRMERKHSCQLFPCPKEATFPFSSTLQARRKEAKIYKIMKLG